MLHYARMMNRAASSFTPVLRTYASGTSVTETAPAGATNVVIEAWAGGGGGSRGSGTGCAAIPKFAGGSSGYSRSSYVLNGAGTQTVAYSVGAAGAGQQTAGPGTAATGGTASSVVSGTLAVTTMTANGGGGSTTTVGGAGGTATGGTAANTAGATDTGPFGVTLYPASGINANTGATPPNGDGGQSGVGSASNGSAGTVGLVAFYYT